MSVSELKEYHDKNRTGSAPTYNIEQLAGSMFRATCYYSNRQVCGYGSSKKVAQRQAADEMLKYVRCNKTVPHQKALNLNDQQLKKAAQFLLEYRNDESKDLRNEMNIEQRINGVHLGLKNQQSLKLNTLLCKKYEDAIDFFKIVMEEMNLQFFCKVPEIKTDSGNSIILLIIDHNYLVAGGMGQSLELAVYAACTDAINMLRILIA